MDYQFSYENSERLDWVFCEEDVEGLPKTYTDTRHSHPLLLTYAPYLKVPMYKNKSYICNSCQNHGEGYSYHCAECRFDVHPGCCELTHPRLFNDPRYGAP